MSSPEIPYTITYRRPGTHPPVFVAGSFTEPRWHPQEMHHTKGPDGEYLFSKELHVIADRSYEVKFKIGEGDWWVYDESKPVVTDCDGNENNLLVVPSPLSPMAGGRRSSGKVLCELGLMDTGHRTLAPITAVNFALKKDADVLDQTANDDEYDVQDDAEPEYTLGHGSSQLNTPLFAHECFGPYDFLADDRLDHADHAKQGKGRHPRKQSEKLSVDQVDINDPSLERFPSDKTSVLDSLRKIQSSLTADQVRLDEAPVFVGTEFRRSSVDSIGDSAVSTGSLSPTSPTTHRMRETRASQGSFGKTKSTTSLGSIAEEPKGGSHAKARPHASSPLPKPRDASPLSNRCSPSDDGAGAVVTSSNKINIDPNPSVNMQEV